MQQTWVQFLGGEDPLEKEMATLFSILAWEIPRTEEPGGLQSTGLQRFRHDLVTKQQQQQKQQQHRQEYFSSIKKKEILPFATWMAIMLTEISQRMTSTLQSYM